MDTAHDVESEKPSALENGKMEIEGMTLRDKPAPSDDAIQTESRRVETINRCIDCAVVLLREIPRLEAKRLWEGIAWKFREAGFRIPVELHRALIDNRGEQVVTEKNFYTQRTT